jgi:hypothetical protein
MAEQVTVKDGKLILSRVKGRLLAATVIVAAHATGCASPAGLPAFEDVQVGARGQEGGGEFCADFALTAA